MIIAQEVSCRMLLLILQLFLEEWPVCRNSDWKPNTSQTIQEAIVRGREKRKQPSLLPQLQVLPVCSTSGRGVLPFFNPQLCRRSCPACLVALDKKRMWVGVWLQCGTSCLSGEEEVNLWGAGEGCRSQSSDFLAPWLLRLDCSAELSQRWSGKPESLAVTVLLAVIRRNRVRNSASRSKFAVSCCKWRYMLLSTVNYL